MLRKDFILDELQIVEARAAGAAAVLLIVRGALASRARRAACLRARAGLEALVEVHTPDELAARSTPGAINLGVNSRDLDTFTSTPFRLDHVRAVPARCVAVAESGMASVADVEAPPRPAPTRCSSARRSPSPPSLTILLGRLSAVARRGR